MRNYYNSSNNDNYPPRSYMTHQCHEETGQSVAVLMTCHNRKEKTLACLEALFANNYSDTFILKVFLLDDGSTDGTVETVSEKYPDVMAMRGDGNNYWNGGMRIAFAEAMKHSYDYYLWLNDDTNLYPHAINTLLDTESSLKLSYGSDTIVIGSTQDVAKDVPTYGGVIRRSKFKRLKFSLVTPSQVPEKCETMNGNCVLIPAKIATHVGNLDASFTHGMGDFDYGLRARKLGYSIYVAPGFVGTCSKNPVIGGWQDTSLPFVKRWRILVGPKGLPFKEWMHFCKRHAGIIWPFYVINPYVKLLCNK